MTRWSCWWLSLAMAGFVTVEATRSHAAGGAALTDAGPAGAEARPDAPADRHADNAGDAVEPIEIQVVPNNVSMNASLHFDEQGLVRSENHNLSINCYGFLPEGKQVLGYRIVEFEAAVTSAGEKLLPQHHHGDQWQQIHEHHRRQTPPRFYLNTQLSPPSLEAKTIRRLAGTVELRVAVPPVRRAVLAPIEEVEGKTAEIRGVDDCRVRAQRTADDALRVDYIGSGWQLLDEAKFLTAEGIELSANGWSGGGNPGSGRYHREYRMTMPDGGRLVFDLWEGVETVTARFEMTDIPLPGAAAGDEVDFAIEAKPRDQEAAALPGVPGLPRLEVVLLGDDGDAG